MVERPALPREEILYFQDVEDAIRQLREGRISEDKKLGFKLDRFKEFVRNIRFPGVNIVSFDAGIYKDKESNNHLIMAGKASAAGGISVDIRQIILGNGRDGRIEIEGLELGGNFLAKTLAKKFLSPVLSDPDKTIKGYMQEVASDYRVTQLSIEDDGLSCRVKRRVVN